MIKVGRLVNLLAVYGQNYGLKKDGQPLAVIRCLPVAKSANSSPLLFVTRTVIKSSIELGSITQSFICPVEKSIRLAPEIIPRGRNLTNTDFSEGDTELKFKELGSIAEGSLLLLIFALKGRRSRNSLAIFASLRGTSWR